MVAAREQAAAAMARAVDRALRSEMTLEEDDNAFNEGIEDAIAEDASRRAEANGRRVELYGSIEVENSEGIPQDGPAVAAGPQPRGMEDADEENNADTSSVTFTQVGESWASSQALGNDAEEAVVTAVAGRRMELKTSPVHRTDLTAERPELRRQSTWTRGELAGNIGFLYSSPPGLLTRQLACNSGSAHAY